MFSSPEPRDADQNTDTALPPAAKRDRNLLGLMKPKVMWGGFTCQASGLYGLVSELEARVQNTHDGGAFMNGKERE
jgi:hypothetical protein